MEHLISIDGISVLLTAEANLIVCLLNNERAGVPAADGGQERAAPRRVRPRRRQRHGQPQVTNLLLPWTDDEIFGFSSRLPSFHDKNVGQLTRVG